MYAQQLHNAWNETETPQEVEFQPMARTSKKANKLITLAKRRAVVKTSNPYEVLSDSDSESESETESDSRGAFDTLSATFDTLTPTQQKPGKPPPTRQAASTLGTHSTLGMHSVRKKHNKSLYMLSYSLSLCVNDTVCSYNYLSLSLTHSGRCLSFDSCRAWGRD